MRRFILNWWGVLLILVAGCSSGRPKPRPDINGMLRQTMSSRRDPSLGQAWLASLGNERGGRERVQLIDLKNRRLVPLPGINRADSQPISVSVSSDGERLAVVQQRDNRTEVFLYRRSVGALQQLPLDPPGVPRSVSLDGLGRLLAVQVSRNGRWEIDLIHLP
ncbi:hypothetical protein [Synechococcus sp. M16CYN]|uniref:TolB family protein n=1 Tax=Synechococcus sp. M16CYN TaxID=3103139 RepID=UPI003249554F